VFDISATPGDLLLQGMPKTVSVVLDGADISAQCYWYTPSAGYASPLPTGASPNFVIIPNEGGKQLVVTGQPGATPYRIDAVDCPRVSDLPFVGDFDPPTYFYIRPTSVAAITKTWANMNYAASLDANGHPIPGSIAPDGFTWGRDGDIDYIALCAFLNGHPRLINWTYMFPKGTRELYVGEWLWLDDTIWDSAGEDGIKWSGVNGLDSQGRLQSVYSIFEQSLGAAKLPGGGVKMNPRNRNLYGVHDYYHDISSGSVSAGHPSFAVITTNRWYWAEMRACLNTPGQSDGIVQMWINGHLLMDQQSVAFSNLPDMYWRVQIQRYAGGLDHWLLTPDILGKKPLMRIGPFGVSARRIGMPPERPQAA
jgi:hypothetical protein